MRGVVRIVSWFVVLLAPMIAVVFTVSWRAGAMAIAGSVVVCFIAVRRISRLVEENRLLALRVIEVDQMKKEFISHVSHELKAPLASMQETTHLILERIPGSLTEKQERLLQLNLQSGKRLAVMLGNLLDLSLLEAGIADYEMKLQDIVEIAKGVLVQLSPQALEKSLHVVTEFPQGPMMVMCDATRMIQIVGNLVENAMRFSKKGGLVSVRISAVETPPKRIPQSLTSAEGFVQIAIADSGPGIENTHKEAVFQTFHQVKKGKKTLGQSLGLGLAISRTLVAAHKGALWIEDNPDGGSVFFMLLPKATPKSNRMPRAS